MQACAYDAAAAGLRVAYLGHEVTADEFNARAADLAERRGDDIDDELRGQLAGVRYLDLGAVVLHAWDDPAEWVRGMRDRFDVVIVDPLSAVASTLDLNFDQSNAEYARFHDLFIQPLATAGLTVVSLDNIGHAIEARSRAKGASAKQDRADLTFYCKLKAQPVGLIITAQKIRSVRVPFKRGDSWAFDRETQRIERYDGEQGAGEPTWRPTVLMERVSRAVEATPGITRTAIRNTVQGKAQTIGTALDFLIADGYVEHRDAGHYSLRSYSDSSDQNLIDTQTRSRQVPADSGEPVPARSPHSSAVPDPFPSVGNGHRSPVSPPYEVGGNGHGNGTVIPLATPEEQALIARQEETA